MRPSPRWLLPAVLFVGALLRIAFFVEHQSAPDFNHPTLDALYHHHYARGLALDDWELPPDVPDPEIREHPYYRPPGYPLLLAAAYLVSGGSHAFARALQHLLGLLVGALVFLLARRWGAGSLGAAVGALFALTSPTLLYFEGELVAAAPSAAAVLVLVLLGERAIAASEAPSSWLGRWGLFGLVLGLSALLRPNLAVLGPALGVFALWRADASARRRVALGVVLAGLVSTLPILGVSVRNHRVSGEWVWLSTNGEATLLYGNHERATGADMVLPERGLFAGVRSVSPFTYEALKTKLGRKTGRDLTYDELGELFTAEVKRYWGEHPGDALKLTFKKALLLVGPDAVANNKQVPLEISSSRVLRFSPGRWWLLFPLAVLGGAAFLRRRRGDEENVAHGWGLAALGALSLLLVLVPFLPAARFRAPVEPALALLAAGGVSVLVRAKQQGALGSLLLPGALAVVALALSAVGWTGYEPDAARWHLDRATAFERGKKLPEARAELEAALVVNPRFSEAHVALGFLDARSGNPEGARAHFQAAVDAGAGARARAGLAASLTLAGRVEEALPHFEAALAEDPEHVYARYNYGVALARLGRHQEAKVQYEKVLTLEPEHPGARNNLGRTLLALGQAREAYRVFAEALRRRPGDEDLQFNLAVALSRYDRVAALGAYQSLLNAHPDHLGARINLASLLLDQGQVTMALPHFEDVHRRAPGVASLFNLARAEREAGREPSALQHLREAFAARQKDRASPGPSLLEIDEALANLLATAGNPSVRNPAEALQRARSVAGAIKRSHPAPLYTLAAALEASGQHAEAQRTREEARALCAQHKELAAVCRELEK